MSKLILFLSYILILDSCVLRVHAQTPCPNSFKCGDTVVDTRDGYKYSTVQIGTQCWFQLNLKATKYLNGDSIPHITADAKWDMLSTGAWCDYNYDAANGLIYGHLYNWFAATDNRSICPKSWYVPDYNEWLILINYLGGASVAGAAMKETGSAHWNSPNTGATNSSGFSALPGGDRYATTYDSPSWGYLWKNGFWWSSTDAGAWYIGWFCELSYNGSSASMAHLTTAGGMSVRCFRDY